MRLFKSTHFFMSLGALILKIDFTVTFPKTLQMYIANLKWYLVQDRNLSRSYTFSRRGATFERIYVANNLWLLDSKTTVYIISWRCILLFKFIAIGSIYTISFFFFLLFFSPPDESNEEAISISRYVTTTQPVKKILPNSSFVVQRNNKCTICCHHRGRRRLRRREFVCASTEWK